MRPDRNRLTLVRRGVLPAAALGVLAASTVAIAGPTPAQKCQDAAMNAGIKYYSSVIGAIAACEAGRSDGSIPEATNCRPSMGAVGDAPTLSALVSADLNLEVAVGKKCLDADVAASSFAKPCDGVTTVAALVSCMTSDAHRQNAEDLVVTVYGDGGTLASPGAPDCLADTIGAASKYATGRLKARRKCAKSIVSGKASGPCPDLKTNAKFDKAVTKLKDTITGSCGTTTVDTLTPGFPCDLFLDATFDRQGNNNRITSPNRFARCIAAAATGSADLASTSANALDDPAPFAYGVTAGDATETAFVAWTRSSDSVTSVTLEVATDAEFATIVDTQVLSPDAAADGVVRTEVTGLTAGTQYWYRFTQGSATSRVGRVQTAPAAASTDPVTFAFTGDANAYFQPFTVLEQITEAAPDLWLFVGDTIYGDDPRSGTGIAEVRSEYHTKYKENRQDRSMRDVMSSAGMYNIWDDHEVTNDFWGTDPSILAQMQEGNQAFRDYMPVRVDGGDPMKLYRSFKWGNVAEFFLIDTRQYRSSQADITEPSCVTGVCSVTTSTDCKIDADCLMGETCMKGACSETDDPCNTQMDCDLIQPGQFCDQNQGDTLPDATCMLEIENPSRTYLGATQLAWLKNGLQNSTATFKFVMNGPLISEILFVPYDRWEGYAAERADLLEFIRTNSVDNVVFLSTDIHAAIVNDEVDPLGSVREMVAGAVGMDPIYRELPASVSSLVGTLPIVFPSVNYFDLDRFNVATATVSQDELQMTWYDASGQVLKSLTVDAE